ncbi:helix-turn-helix domain-containing protein [Desulfovermiculus halophilus]|uniref:helix-turn-helix domain-containing protein n=1 Tax=Desulfovermiculus halophilus TaxID=339722 RepID=UPI0012948776|nr:helix-turn-helix domain-containing protein [Desulfovermiculus halophilus]
MDIAITTCPEGRLRKKKHARLQSLIRDLSVLLREIDPNRIGLTYCCRDKNDPFDEESLSDKDGDYRGPLFELTQVSCRYMQITLPQNSSSLGTAIKRALEATSYSTLYNPTSAIKTPQEIEKEKVLEMREQNLSTREIAKDLGISKSKVSRILRRQ